MRAVIIATGCAGVWEGLGAAGASALLPVGDRPILQHVLERLVSAGFRDFDLVLGDAAERVEKHLGNGQRWGCQIQYHLTSGFDKAVSLVPSLAQAGHGVMLAQGDVLPVDPLPDLGERALLLHTSAAGHAVDDAGWTGWAWIPEAVAAAMPAQVSWAGLRDWLAARGTRVETQAGLSARDGEAYLASQTTALTTMAEQLQFSAFPAGEGIWIGRNVSLPPRAQVHAPALIGDNSQIGRGVVIGPSAVLCAGCLVDDQSHIVNAVVLAGSYIGRQLDVQDSVVHHHRLLNVKLGAVVTVQDAFLLGHVESGGASESMTGVLAHLLARLAALPALPVVALLTLVRLVLGRRPAIYERRFVRSPAPLDGPWPMTHALSFVDAAGAARADGWRHFWLVFLPGLGALALGRARLVGAPPRDEIEMRKLPDDWREIALQARPGLLSESFVQNGPEADEDERYASEAFSAVAADWRFSMRILTRYLMLLALGRADPAEIGSARRS